MRLLKNCGLVLVLMLAVGAAGASDKERGYLGVTLVSVENVHEGSQQNGLFVGKVFAGSGAEAAGIESHDRIVAVDGIQVANLDDLHQTMGKAGVGDAFTLTIRRDAVDFDTTIVLGKDPGIHEKRFGVVLDEKRAFIGVHVQELGPQLGEYFEVEGGVLITEVIEDGPAMRAGIRAGDVLLEIDGRSLAGHGTLHRLMGDVEKGQRLDVRLQRRGQLMSFYVEADTRKSHHSTLDLRRHFLHRILQKTDSVDGTLEIVVPHEDSEGEVLLHEVGELHEDDPKEEDN